jgi:hypothetical protein
MTGFSGGWRKSLFARSVGRLLLARNMQVPEPATRAAILWTWGMAVAFVVAALMFFTRHQDFPYLYHTDESSKVQQIIRRDYNFNHPLLLVRTTEALVAATGAGLKPQAVVEKGRLASAIFAALATGLMVVFASGLAGRAAGALTGVLVITHPVLYELSHYMKEDCALLVGIAATVLALVHYASAPSAARAALVGAAAGLAVSGKYLGGVVAGMAILALARHAAGTTRRWIPVFVAVLALVAVFAAINYPSLLNYEAFTKAQERELAKIGKRAEERPEPIQLKHLSKLGTSLSAPLLAGLLFWAMRRWRLRNHEPCVWRMLGGMFVIYFLVVSLAPKTKDRYLLPVYVLGCGLGAVGLVEWHRHFRRHRKSYTRGIPRTVAALAIGWHLPRLVDTYHAFQRDDRRELVAYIRATIPPEAGIAQDVRVLLARAQGAGPSEFSLPNPLFAPPDRWVADLGSIAELRARGITHVAVCEADYHLVTRGGREGKGAARGRWYAELFENYPVVWQRKAGEIEYLQPGLSLYRIAP